MSDAWLFVLLVVLISSVFTLAVFSVLFITRALVLGTGALARWVSRLW